MLNPTGAVTANSHLQTLDEPVAETLKRDLRAIGVKLKFVLLPYITEEERVRELRNWDLWVSLRAIWRLRAHLCFVCAPRAHFCCA